jgi:Flp pilus assembly pilin Flp
MLLKARGGSMVEYVVMVVLIIGLVGGALVALAATIYGKLNTVYVDIGS